MSSQQSWFTRRVSGPPLQKLWQSVVGGAIFIVFVGVPMTSSAVKTQSIKKAKREGTLINPIQRRVYEQRLALRSDIASTKK
jgi:hypothetical protein